MPAVHELHLVPRLVRWRVVVAACLARLGFRRWLPDQVVRILISGHRGDRPLAVRRLRWHDGHYQLQEDADG